MATVITPNDKKLTRESWAEIEKDLEGAGLTLFTELFRVFPDYVKMFTRLKTEGEEDLLKSPKFIKHMATALLPAVTEMLQNLDDEAALKDQLLIMGENHRKRNLNRSHFENIKPVIITMLETQLGDSFTAEMKEAWLKVLSAGFQILYISLENENY